MCPSSHKAKQIKNENVCFRIKLQKGLFEHVIRQSPNSKTEASLNDTRIVKCNSNLMLMNSSSIRVKSFTMLIVRTQSGSSGRSRWRVSKLAALIDGVTGFATYFVCVHAKQTLLSSTHLLISTAVQGRSPTKAGKKFYLCIS